MVPGDLTSRGSDGGEQRNVEEVEASDKGNDDEDDDDDELEEEEEGLDVIVMQLSGGTGLQTASCAITRLLLA